MCVWWLVVYNKWRVWMCLVSVLTKSNDWKFNFNKKDIFIQYIMFNFLSLIPSHTLQQLHDVLFIPLTQCHIILLNNGVHCDLLPKNELTHNRSTENHTVNLTIESVNCATVSRESIREILDSIRSLYSRCQKPCKWSNQWCRQSENNAIKLSWHTCQRTDSQNLERKLVCCHFINWVHLRALIVFKRRNRIFGRVTNPIITARWL